MNTAFRAFLSIGFVLALTARLSANSPPATPTITEPDIDGDIVNAEDVHMETAPFSDPDPGDTHVCTDWQIWTISPSSVVWSISCIGGVERVHVHLGDGVFQNAYAGRASLLPSTNYQLRVRHKDSSGDAATQWSAFASRNFTTSPATVIYDMETEDVAAAPAPTLTDAFANALVLPEGSPSPRVRMESADGSQLLLQIDGDDGSANQITNPPSLGAHVELRVHLYGGSTGISMPETNLTFFDEHGGDKTIYLPGVILTANQEAVYWVSTSGATFVGNPAQSVPDFSTPARSAPVPWTVFQPGYRVEVVASGLQLPVNIAFIPNAGASPNSPYFYVTELYGNIKVVRRNGVVSSYASNLLNYTPSGQFPGSGEQGLTGIVVEPTTGDVIAAMLYDSAGNHYPKVVRYHSNDGGLTAGVTLPLLNMVGETQGQSHQVSNLSIGPDGKLYIHNGDGFDATKGQDLTSFRGKILRINIDGTVPNTNPFYNAADGLTARDYVFAYGLRNPFGGAWRAADGFHYELENGPSRDRIAKVVQGTNYLYNGTDASMLNLAIFNWFPAVGPVNLAFIQTSTFNGSGFPAAKMDHMFITESGPTWGTGPQVLGKRIVEFTLDAMGAITSGPTTLVEYNGTGKSSCVGLTAGPDGLYFTDLYRESGYTGPSDVGGNILRVRFVGTADFTANTTSGPGPLNVQFTDTSNAIGPTAWNWSFGDGATSTAQNPLHAYTQPGAYNVRLTLTTPNGPIVQQKNAFILVGTLPKIALIGGTIPPSQADSSIADHLRGLGFTVTAYDDEPANRPSAATLGAQNNLVMVSSTITVSNVLGQFRTVNVPLLFWEQGLLRTDREALASGGVAVTGTTAINLTNNTHFITQGLALGTQEVYSAGANMSVGQGTIAPNASILATRNGSTTDVAIMTCEPGLPLLSGYIPLARRVFMFIEDQSWLYANPPVVQVLDRGSCWAMGLGAPAISTPAAQTVYAGDTVVFSATVTSSPPASMQWQRNASDLSDGGRTSGAQSPTLTIQAVRASDAGLYTLSASTPCGEATSASALLTVRLPGDVNCDGALTVDDVAPMILALIDPAGYAAAYPTCPTANGDVNRDGNVDGLDIASLAAALAQ